jgi:hypothetical protein
VQSVYSTCMCVCVCSYDSNFLPSWMEGWHALPAVIIVCPDIKFAHLYPHWPIVTWNCL